MEPDIKLWLDQRADAEGVPMTELVRRALREMRAREEQSLAGLLAETSGICTAGDGLAYQRSMREEWKSE